MGEAAGLGLVPVQKDRLCGRRDLKWKHESLFKRVFEGRPLRELLEAGLIKMGRGGRCGEQANLRRGRLSCPVPRPRTLPPVLGLPCLQQVLFGTQTHLR